ncbi:MAG: archaeal proteasome endopeptidase complex subunit alpha [Thaumarchaeota archaeon]|nr:archaeal proteasome endopeptidase complex subunit alpha [Nitrososphaerota archaeon]
MASRGYDMTPTMYSPDGRIYQVEYAIETVNRGTLAVGIRSKGGVVLAVEEKSRTLQVSNITQKIFQVDQHVGIAAAGYIPDARVQVDNARFFSQSNRINYDEAVEIETIAKYLADQSHRYTQYSGVRPYGVALIVAGVDQKGSSIYMTDPSGIYVSYAAVAIGANSDDVTKFFENNYTDDINLEDAMTLASLAINIKNKDKKNTENIKMEYISTAEKKIEKINKNDLDTIINNNIQKYNKQ